MDLDQPKRTNMNDLFISYSRKDLAFARVLEAALESYRPPKDLDAPHRHLIVFRDEEDFTGVDYHASIEKHLHASARMILICSPHSRNSTYVNEEVQQFTAMKGAQNIIPVLLSGIPNNEARPGQEYEMAFPDALTAAMEMPLAVSYLGFDVKRDSVDKGAFYGSWCSILANLYRVSRSEIEQRDKKRQSRRRFRTVSAVSLVIIALSALSVYAWMSRNEAVRQRRIADSQKKVVLKAFNQLTYMVPEALKQVTGNLAARERLARGNIASLEELVHAVPESTDIQRELATNYRLLGTILLEAGKYREAQRAFRASAERYGPLIRTDKQNALWHRDLAVSLYNSGLMFEKLGDPTRACKEYLQSHPYARTAAALDGRWADLERDIASRLAALACR